MLLALLRYYDSAAFAAPTAEGAAAVAAAAKPPASDEEDEHVDGYTARATPSAASQRPSTMDSLKQKQVSSVKCVCRVCPSPHAYANPQHHIMSFCLNSATQAGAGDDVTDSESSDSGDEAGREAHRPPLLPPAPLRAAHSAFLGG